MFPYDDVIMEIYLFDSFHSFAVICMVLVVSVHLFLLIVMNWINLFLRLWFILQLVIGMVIVLADIAIGP